MRETKNGVEVREDWSWWAGKALPAGNPLSGLFRVEDEAGEIDHLKNARDEYRYLAVDATAGLFGRPVGVADKDVTVIGYPPTRDGFKHAFRIVRSLLKTEEANLEDLKVSGLFVQVSVYHKVH